MPKFYNVLIFSVKILLAQSPELDKDIRARLATVALENRVILAADGRLTAWANHYELLFDSFVSPFDSQQANFLIQKYAAERVFVAADYLQKTAFVNWAKNHNLLISELPPLAKNANFILNDASTSEWIADALRQKTAQTLQIWWAMLAGIIAGVLIYGLFRIRKIYKYYFPVPPKS